MPRELPLLGLLRNGRKRDLVVRAAAQALVALRPLPAAHLVSLSPYG